MKKVSQRILAGWLTTVLAFSVCGAGADGEWRRTRAAGEPGPAYRWTFEETDGRNISNSGTAAAGAAVLQGTAKIETQSVAMAGKEYLPASNHVLTLSGGGKGSSYVDLPQDLYKGVSAETGLTWSFWVKPSEEVTRYSRVFSSADSQSGNEFAFTPYAPDSVWNLIFDGGTAYRQVLDSEPDKGVWNLVTITVSGETVKCYQNGALMDSTCASGDGNVLKSRLGSLGGLVNHALGKTCSTWGDGDCAVQLDDVSVYHMALTAEQVKAMAEKYGIDVSQQTSGQGNVSDDDGSKGLTEVEELRTSSVDGSNVVKIWKDAKGSYYYSAYRNDEIVVRCSLLGVHTKKINLSENLTLDSHSIKKEKGKEEYDLLQGSTSHVSKEYQEMSFSLTGGDSKITVMFRLFEDGVAYRYEIDGDTKSKEETTEITSEDSSFLLPDASNIWTMSPSVTYEASNYVSRKVSKLKGSSESYGAPILGKVPTHKGDYWILLAEANVYNEEEPYCASGFATKQGSSALQVNFGSYLVEEQDSKKDGKTYTPTYAGISSVTMNDVFHTPWRAVLMTDNLEALANSSLIADLNPPAEGDFSWVEPGTSSWSWWSTTSDAIDYDTMFDYIDYAQETGQKYCLIDFGWEVWKDYETKIKDLVAYAEPKGVKLILWYGVNKFDQPHKFDLDNPETIEKQFAWCESLGVKGVKVDYINSDSQFAMKVMYDLASIAAKHKLILNYHGCTDPNGENRTFPNILSSEAVMGSEYFKWGGGSPVQSLLTLPYARNVTGSMEFTPVGMSVKNVEATDGFMLAMPVVYESAIQTLAHSAYVYPGYEGLSLLVDLPSSWDESRLISGYPGTSVIRARKKGENWYVGAMTKEADSYEIPLDFLDKGETYYAAIYTDKANGGLEVKTENVSSESVLKVALKKAGGCAIKITKSDVSRTTVYDGYTYYEAEDAQCSSGTEISETDYVSGKKFVNNVGGSDKKAVTFTVDMPEAGEYECRVFLVSAAARTLLVQANQETPVEMKKVVGVAGDGNAVSAKSIILKLNKGSNVIQLYNTSLAPGIDRIAISKDTKMDISKAEVSLSRESYEYTGERNVPDVTVTDGTTALVKGVDYDIYYSSTVKKGTATVTVTGKGKYAGIVKKTYQIVAGEEETPAPTLTPQPTPTPIVTPEPTAPQKPEGNSSGKKVSAPGKVTGVKVKSTAKKKMTVSFKKMKNVSGYQISYRLNQKGKRAKTVLVKASAAKKVIGKLKSRKQYCVCVRAYRKNGSKKLYGEWSGVKKVKIK